MANDAACGEAALQAVDRLLEDKPDKVGHDFSAAEHAVAMYRDALTAVWRRSQAEADRVRLAQVNAVLSVVMGGHFPLGGVPWGHISKARDLLAELVDQGGRDEAVRLAANGTADGAFYRCERHGEVPMKQPHTEQTVRHTDDQQNTGTHKKPGTADAKGADRFGGTRTGNENVEPETDADHSNR